MIRKATLDDIPQMAKTEMRSFNKERYPIDAENFYELMLSPAQVVLVYDSVETGVCGHLLAEIIDNRTNLIIDSVAVIPEYRGKGIGKDLVRAALEFAKNRNIPSVTLETPEDDKYLHEFYKSLNFKKIGRQDNFYGDGVACIIMKAIFALLLLLPLPASAQDGFTLRLPVACEYGTTCWPVSYPDSDPALSVAKDFTCGPLASDGNDGTDFGIRDLVAMETGIVVVAAADGKVLRKRDGAGDTMPTHEDIQKLLSEKKGCGNGLAIEHTDGWQTLYCNIKNGSFRVEEGQQVKAGDILGHVGHSGAAEYPRLHFTLVKEGQIFDPFTGNRANTTCQSTGKSLWNPPLAYIPVSLFAGGFTAGVPNIESLRIDATAPDTLRQNDVATLTFWVGIYGTAAGGKIEIEIIGPNDQIVARRDITQKQSHARQYYYVGKKFGEQRAAPGNYTGVVTLSRSSPDGKTLIRTRESLVKIN